MINIETLVTHGFFLLIGILIGELLMLSLAHKKWYGSYIIKRENLPLIQKVKERLKKGVIKI